MIDKTLIINIGLFIREISQTEKFDVEQVKLIIRGLIANQITDDVPLTKEQFYEQYNDVYKAFISTLDKGNEKI